MIIKQEETSPVADVFDRLKLEIAFGKISEKATGRVIDSDVLHTYIDGTIKLLKDFDKGLTNVEKDLSKRKNEDDFREALFGNDDD